MLSFKQYINLYYINENLNKDQQKYVDSLNLDTSRGKQTFEGIIPSDQTHTDKVPLEKGIPERLEQHFEENPVKDRTGKVLGNYKLKSKIKDKKLFFYAKHPADGSEVSLAKAVDQKKDPDLYSDYIKYNARGDLAKKANNKIIISRHPYAILGKSEGKSWKSCAGWSCDRKIGSSTLANGFLKNDVRVGGGVAYLTSSKEKIPDNPKTAKARISIHPYHAVDERGRIIRNTDGTPEHTIMRASEKTYGTDENGVLRNSIEKYLKEKQPMIHNHYVLDPDVYQSDETNKIKYKPLEGQEKVDALNKFNQKIKEGAVTSEDIEHARNKDYLTNEHTRAIAKNKDTDEDMLNTLTGVTNDRLTHLAIAKHHNASGDALDVITDNSHEKDNELHKAIANNHNSYWDTLHRLAEYNNNDEVHTAIANNNNTDNSTLEHLANNSDSSMVHEAIANNHNTSDYTLDTLTRKSKDPKVHAAIANHHNADFPTLGNLARKSNDPDIHKSIVKHPNTDDYTLDDLAKKSKNPDVLAAIKERKEHNLKLAQDPNTDRDKLYTLARKSNDPKVHAAIAKNHDIDSYTLNYLSQISNDPELHTAIANNPNADSSTLSSLAQNSKNPKVQELIRKNPNWNQN